MCIRDRRCAALEEQSFRQLAERYQNAGNVLLVQPDLEPDSVRRLKELYPDAACSLDYGKDYELLFSVRLAAQCTDARVNPVSYTHL